MEWFWFFLTVGIVYPSFLLGKLVHGVCLRLQRGYRNQRIVRCWNCNMTYRTRDLWFAHDFGCKIPGCEHEPLCGICILKGIPAEREVNLNTLLKLGVEE